MTAANPENPFAGQGSVLLDIGGDVGALVVTMPEGIDGFEVEIQPAGTGPKPVVHQSTGHAHHHGPGHDHGHDHEHGQVHGGHRQGEHPHVAVVSRRVGEGSVPSLVFPDVVEGDYELVPKDGGPVQLHVHVAGGAVTTVAWTGSPVG